MHAVFLPPSCSHSSQDVRAIFRGCAFEKRTGNELWEVTKPISSFLCQRQAFLLTQQVKSHLFGTAPEVPDITASRKLVSHPKHELSGWVSVTVRVLPSLCSLKTCGQCGLNNPIARSTGTWSGLFVLCWLPESALHLHNILHRQRWKKVSSLQKLPEVKPSWYKQQGSNNSATMQIFFLLLLPYWFMMWIEATLTLQPLLFISCKRSSTSASRIAGWSLSNLSTWTKAVWDPWTKSPICY